MGWTITIPKKVAKDSVINNLDFQIRNCTASSAGLTSSQSSRSQLRCGCEDVKPTEPTAHLRLESSKLFIAES